MKRTLSLLCIFLIPLYLFPQKATVKIVKTRNVSMSEWKILDDRLLPLFSETDFYPLDTVTIGLEANRRYFFQVSFSGASYNDTSLYSLSLNGVTIIYIKTDMESGDHSYPFFTGVASDQQAKIAGGTNTDISDFPWQIYLEAGNFTCGGSIISGRWIITAAHCTRDDANVTIPASEMVVTVGANNPRIVTQGKDYLVSQVVVHENYDPNTLENDIALLKLYDSINYPNATPIKLISANDASEGFTDPGVLSWVTGYGLTKVRPATYPTTLQKVQLPIVSNAVASTVWSQIPSTDLMAGYANGGKDACSGDSGGPLVVPVSTGYKLAGLVSWGSNNCNTYGAYTRVSLFESWITQKTGIEISFNAPVPVGDSIICPGTSFSQYSVARVNGATAYNWALLPASAGTISGNNETAGVSWNADFKGKASVTLQVIKNTNASEISLLVVTVAKQTRLISQTSDTVICANQPVNLVMKTEGHDLIYNWYKTNNLIQSGPSNQIIITNSILENSGIYYCDISGSCGSVTSGNLSLTVLPLTQITDISPDTELAFGSNLSLNVASEGHNLEYQWKKDGNTLSGAVSSGYNKQDVNANDIGIYQVKVTGTCGTETSNNIYVYVKSTSFVKEPEVFVWPTLINNGFTVALSNEQTYNVLLFNTIGKLLEEKKNCQYQTSFDIGELPRGIYILRVYNDNFRKSIKLIKN
ncbi:MAG: trypsin-like serine protease [Bacteroidota bacterium]|nr:trypsin-like serine protease [Bacteroidota bacterium]